MTSIFEKLIIFAFQFSDYIHSNNNNSHKKKFAQLIKNSIKLIINNRLRSADAKSIQRNIKFNSFPLSFYSFEWLTFKTILRRFIRRFDEDITSYRFSFDTSRNRSVSFSANNSFELFAFQSKRFRFQSSIRNINRRLSFSHFSFSSLTSTLSTFTNRSTFSILNFSVSRASFISESSIESKNFASFNNIDNIDSINTKNSTFTNFIFISISMTENYRDFDFSEVQYNSL